MLLRTALIPIALLWLAGTALRIPVLATPPLIPAIHDDLALTATGVGILAGLPIVLFACVALPGSLLIARIGAARALIVGLIVCAVGGALRGASPDALTLYFTTAVMGAGVAVMQPALPPLVRQWMPGHMGFGTAVFTNGLLVGEIIPVALTLPLIVPLLGGWRPAFVFWALPVLAIAVAVALFHPKEEAPPSAERPRWWPDWKSALLWKIAIAFGTVNAMYFASNAFLPDYLTALGRADLISEALTALNVGQLPASFLMLAFAERLQGRAWPFAFTGTLALLSVAGIVSASGGWIVLWAAVLGFCCAGVLVLALALPPFLFKPADVARASAAVFTISYGCAVIVPLLSGLAWDLSGRPALAFVPIGLCAALLVALTPIFRFRTYRA